MTEEAQNQEAATTEVEAPAAKPVTKLCKGQMPSPLVWYIKFHEAQENRSAIAAKYFTTSGKVTDIQTNANQRYIVEDMAFTSEELDDAAAKIRENFVRGQADVEAGATVSPRQLATTTAEDAEYALSVIEIIRGMTSGDEAISLEAARAEYNEANPRKKAVKAEDAPADDGTEAGDDAESGDDDAESGDDEELEGLLD